MSPNYEGGGCALRLLNALNSEDRGLKVRFSLATIAFDRESAQMSRMLSSQGKNEKRTFKPLSSLFSAFSNLKVGGTLKTVTSLNKEARLLKFHFS